MSLQLMPSREDTGDKGSQIPSQIGKDMALELSITWICNELATMSALSFCVFVTFLPSKSSCASLFLPCLFLQKLVSIKFCHFERVKSGIRSFVPKDYFSSELDESLYELRDWKSLNLVKFHIARQQSRLFSLKSQHPRHPGQHSTT